MAEYPTLLFDCDDVLLDLMPRWLRFLNGMYGTAVEPEDVREWDMTKAFPSLIPAQIYKPLTTMGFWNTTGPVPGAQDGIAALSEAGYTIYVVTATNLYNVREKARRITSLFPSIDDDHIIVAQNKQMIRGDLLVDDAPHNLEGGSYIKLLFTRPHNLSFPTTGTGIIRVSDWEEIYKTITKIYPKGVIQH